MRRRMGLLAVGCVVGFAACGGADGDVGATGAGASDDRLQLATTVAPITSIVAQVAGEYADITGIVPEGTNSHTFEPPPSVAELLSEADVVFVNGLKLEDPTLKLAEKNMKDDGRIVKLGNEVLPEEDYLYDFSFPKAEGRPNPHLWTDPTYARKYAEVVRDTLIEVDPEREAGYEENFAAFAARVDDFDAAIRTSFATLPEEDRKLLTYHDAYAYFAKTYDWKVIGAIQVESFKEPSAREVGQLIEQVRAEGVSAIFGSEVFPSPVLEQIGREAGVDYVDVLRDDDLPGAPGDVDHSWLGLMKFDFVTMVEALGGDATAIKAVEVTSTVEDRSRYPQ